MDSWSRQFWFSEGFTSPVCHFTVREIKLRWINVCWRSESADQKQYIIQLWPALYDIILFYTASTCATHPPIVVHLKSFYFWFHFITTALHRIWRLQDVVVMLAIFHFWSLAFVSKAMERASPILRLSSSPNYSCLKQNHPWMKTYFFFVWFLLWILRS